MSSQLAASGHQVWKILRMEMVTLVYA